MPIGRLRSTVLNAPVRWLGIALGVVALLVSGAFGGFDDVGKASTKALPLEKDKAYELGPWKVTVHRVRLVDELETLVHKEKGSRWLVVVATLEITGDRSSNLFYRAVCIRGAEGVEDVNRATEIRLMSDIGRAEDLHPNLPEPVAFFWEQKAAAPVPDRIQVGLFGGTEEYDKTTNLKGWTFETVPRAYAWFDVEDRRGTA